MNSVENTISNSSSSVACGLTAMGTCLFAKVLLSNGCTYLQDFLITNRAKCQSKVKLKDHSYDTLLAGQAGHIHHTHQG
jgi:hypothetical protein